MNDSPLVILNFGEVLTEDLRKQMVEELGRQVDERRVRLSINAVRLTYPQVQRLMDTIDLAALPTDVVLNVPKLPIGAVYVVNEFYARTGVHPIILELTRDPVDNGERRFGTLRNLELEIKETRRRRAERVIHGESAQTKDDATLLILNFGDPLTDELRNEIEERLGRQVQDRHLRLSINAVRFTYPQVLKQMDDIDLTPLPTDIVLNMPKLPIGAAYLVNEFYARTGVHPTILEMIRDPRELNTRRFGKLRNLELEIAGTRTNKPDRLVQAVLDEQAER